ncbi:two-component regulator propeller domain-containing protein [Penaeicola halotolerans]|uniref:two-component regulator propeller domain-containing protein n=1 Tax=Penaeicola halotolerans TaxID=2793196 RepID=UPI001CF827A3|nr:two-component regulator propeller domain-containing protein [Penaeicola halotolerans]
MISIRNIFYCLFKLLICISFSYHVHGQGLDYSDFKFERIGVKNGLSQSSVLSLHQDSYGFIWIGTRDGLNLYDGYVFDVFKHEVGDSSTLGGNIIYDIAEDDRGDIWVVSENGLSKYDRTLGIFINYELPQATYEATPFNVIYIDDKNQIWIGGRYGLFNFNQQSEMFEPQDDPIFNGIGMISAITSDEMGNIWVGGSRLGLYKINQNGKVEKVKTSYAQSYEARIEAIAFSDRGIWLGTYGDGLFLIDFSGKPLAHYHTGAYSKDLVLSNNNIRVLQHDKEGQLWVGTFNGLNLISDGKISKRINFQEGDAKGLSHGSIRALLLDQKGSMWVGTYFGGINLFDIENQKFKHYYHVPTDLSSLSYDVVGAFVEDAEGNKYIGTERGGINFVNKNKDTHKIIGNAQSTVKAILRDKQDQIWVGIFREGLHLLDKSQNSLIKYPGEQSSNYISLSQSIINCIVEDANNGLWIGTDSDGGLYFFNTIRRQYESFIGEDLVHDFLKNYPVKNILQRSDGTLILATKGKGIVVFDPKSGNITPYEQGLVNGVSVRVDEFNHVFEDADGTLWLASNGEGVFAFDPNSEELRQFHTGNGLANNIVLGTLQDDLGQIWFVCLDGLSKWTPHLGQTFKNYNFNSGFPLEEINEGAFYKLKSGDFLIGGSNGYVMLDPIKLESNSYIPPVVLTSLSISNKEISPRDPTGILSKELNKTEQIVIDYFQSILTLEFAALNYIRPENNQYAYKLEGFDQDWVYSGDRRSVTYTNLPDGTYTFLVKGSNNDGVWNETPKTLEVIVLPPPWRTWWAICLYGVGILLGFWIIRYNAVKSTQLKSNLKLEQLEKEKWKEIHDLKLKYFIDVSHEFRTPLTLILSPLEEIINSKIGDQWLKSRLKIMLFNAKRLLHLIDQILEIREIETGHHKLNLRPVYLDALMQEVIDSFRAMADKRKIKLSYVKTDVREVPLLIDQDKLEKIFFNLLSNAFKFTEEGGEITVGLKLDKDDRYLFSVQDTGSGIAPEDLGRVFDRFFKTGQNNYGAGIGLSLTQSLVNILGGEINVSSKFGEGTLFEFWLPFDPATNQGNSASPEPFTKPIPLEYQDTPLIISSEQSKEEKELILIVEDHQELRRFLKDHLKNEFEISTAKDGKSGLEKVKRKGPALIISDVMMPEMDGFELCKAIKSTNELSHIPVILLTAKNSQMNRLEGLEYGADDYISKPFNILELKARIKNILINRKLLQNKYREARSDISSEESTKQGFDEQLIQKLYEILKENVDQPNLTVDFLGEKVGMSRVHLFRKLKALTGLSPSDFIKEYRMKMALKMLQSGKYRIADVAYAVGFQDVPYFSKVFKKTYGQSPSVYKDDMD